MRKSKNSQMVSKLHPRNNPMLPPISPKENDKAFTFFSKYGIKFYLFNLTITVAVLNYHAFAIAKESAEKENPVLKKMELLMTAIPVQEL